MRYVARRLGFFVVTLWACVTINFVLPRIMPGDPAIDMMSQYKGQISEGTYHAMALALGTDTHTNLALAYVEYLGNTLTGHFGTSITQFPDSVVSVVASALPWTIGLVGLTTVLAFVLGTLIGMAGAWRRGGRLDSLLPPIFVVTSAFPYFWVALVFVLFFAIEVHWLPGEFGYAPSSQISLSWGFIGDVLDHAVLPAVSLLVTSIGGWILTMRNNMITVLSEDYVAMARAAGLSSRRIMLDYAGRNAILPNLTGFAMSLGFVVSGAVLVEYVFNYPGVGFLLLRAVESGDYALMQALFLLITVCVLVAVLLVDFVTVLADPRTRTES
ncbi:MAG TPA: ABC transporter permease [Acidimicrobiales bacterium]|nr:ABC transporter permease [Acidimicrobiales bacterium]